MNVFKRKSFDDASPGHSPCPNPESSLSLVAAKKRRRIVVYFTPGESQIEISQRGVAILELAVVVVTIFVFVSGLVTYSEVLRQINISNDAVRHAARSGGALAYVYPDYCVQLGEASGSCSNLTPPNNLEHAAMNIACQYIQGSGLDPVSFTITATIVGPINEDQFSGRLLRVNSSALRSPLPLADLFGRPTINAEVTYVLERSCNSL